MTVKEAWRGRSDSESECEIKNPLQNFNLRKYLKEEIWQCSRRRNEEDSSQEQICGPFRNRVWKFLSIPQYFESFMFYGLLQCLDHILLVYTFLPLRCLVIFFSLLSFITSSLFGLFVPFLRPQKFTLYATDARELVKFSFVCICTIFLYTFDSSIAYHEIRTQSIIKIYIFFNLLEVADRLLSAIYLDAVDDVLFNVSARLSGLRHPCASSSNHAEPTTTTTTANASPSITTEAAGLGSFLVQFLFALVCLSAHCLLLLAQVTTLNVAFNSQNRSLLTVIISNNFVELKGNVFRKMGKSNLFQIACADVRERFHFIVWLLIIVCRNMSASGWQYEDFLLLLPDILLILLAEVAVDWVKHAFISKFNVIASDVYEEYTVSIAYDLLLCRQGKNSSDYFELLSRRMGLTPISLSCLINVMLIQTVRSSRICILFLLAFPLLFICKVVVHIILLDRAYAHVQAYTQMMAAKLAKEATMAATTAVMKTSATGASTVIAAANDTDGSEMKHKTSIFYSPYTGYDQPTRDEDQLAMPRLLPRRSYSDTTGISPNVPANGDVVEMDSIGEMEEDFFSLLSFSTDASTRRLPQRSILKTPQTETLHFRQFLVDADDMQISQRRTIQLPSLPTSPIRESLNQTGSSSISSYSASSCLFSSSLLCESSLNHVQHQQQNRALTSKAPSSVPLVTLSGKTSPCCVRFPLHNHRNYCHRRCFSLNDVALVSWASRAGLHQSLTASSNVEEVATNLCDNEEKYTHVSRRRLHTENEVSGLLILEQLSSILNDETAHLEGAVDADLLSDEEVAATKPQGDEETAIVNSLASKVEEELKNASQMSPSAESETMVAAAVVAAAEASVKQPLSNVDRYSMLGGQIG